MRCIIIQPYVAPYRYDFFRMLAGKIDLKVLYLWPTPGVDESEETLQQKLGACQVKRLRIDHKRILRYPVPVEEGNRKF